MTLTHIETSPASSLIPATPQPSPTSQPIPKAQTSAPALAPTLAPGWIDRIEWIAFDEAAFLSALGAKIDAYATLPERLRAMHECFPPQANANKLPLDITQFDQETVARFVAGVMGTIGRQELPYAEGDSAFSQDLFKRWFLQIASPLAGDGNGGMLTAPFHGALLHLTHPSNAHRHRCSGGPESDAAAPLPHIGMVKQELLQRYLRSHGDVHGGPAGERAEWTEWAFDGLCQIFEPALLRKDLPDGFRYGSLPWVLLSLGIDLAGDAHAQMNSQALISLGATLGAHYFSDAGDEARPALSQQSMQIMLTMAHVNGAIKLRNTRDVQQKDVETALAFFQSQLFAVEKTLAPLQELIDKTPTRRAVAEAVLREQGIDPARLFFLPPKSDGRIATKRLHRVHCPAEPQRCMSAAELFMRGELPQLRERGALNRHEAPLPEDLSGLTIAHLSERFDREFKTALTPLAHRILAPALEESIKSMDKESEQFWRCADWMVREVEAQVVTDHGSGGFRGGIGVGGSATSSVAYKAQDSVLIRLTLGEGAGQRVQTYWATLEPFQLQRYHGEDAALLGREFRHFFKPGKEGDTLLRLNSQAVLRYEDHTARNGKALLQTIAERLVDHRSARLREDAYQITEPELFEKRLRDDLLRMLPFYGCVKDSMAGHHGAAAIQCTLDLVGMLPVVAAGAKLPKVLFKSRHMSAAQMESVAKAFVLGIVPKSTAHQSIHTILTRGMPFAHAAKAGLALIDPGFGLLYGVAKLPFQFAPTAWKHLKKAFGRIPELQPFTAQLDAAEKLARKCYPDRGFWRARQGTITEHNGMRSVTVEEMRYEIQSVGDVPDVLVMRDGSDFRLANPQSGRAFGPAMRQGPAPGQLELASAANRGANAGPSASQEKFVKAFSALCRVKRAGDTPGACSLVPDERFGPHGYSREVVPPSKNFQVPLTAISRQRTPPLKRMNTFNPFKMGYETKVESPSGALIDIIPDSGSRFVHHPGGANGPQSALHLPPTIEGHIQSLPSKDGGAAIDHVVVSLSHKDEVTGATIHTRRYVPLGTYRELDGELDGKPDGQSDGAVVAIAYFDPLTPYSVRIDPANLPLGEDRLAVTLKRATIDETDKFWRFQNLLATDQRTAFPLVADAVRLADATPAVKERFDVVFEHAAAMLDDAIHVIEDDAQKPLVMQMAAKLFGMPPGEARDDALYPLLNTIWGHLTEMRASMPYLKEQSPYVIGFFQGPQGDASATVRANSFVKLMDKKMSFKDSTNPVMTFEIWYFMNPLEVVGNHAATLLHEWGHALRGMVDKMHPNAAGPVYALLDEETVDLSPLTEAAGQPGSDPANHAPTVEHFLVMAAALRREETKRSVMSYIQTPDSHTYARTVTSADFSAMLGMLGDIVDRPRRAAPITSVRLR